MKKLFKSLMIVAMTAMTFTACQDVPAPYELPGTGANKPDEGGVEVEGATGDGTLASPFNAAAATNVALKLESGAVSEQAYFIKGKVVSIATDKNDNVLNFDQGTYGNASFYISDDGSATNQFYCYRVLYLGNKKWTSGDGDILKVGDDVIVYAKLTLFNGKTPETVQNEGFIYSLNGVSKGGVPEEGNKPSDHSTLEKPYTVSEAVAAGSGNEYVKGFIVGSVEGQVLSSGAHFSTENAVATNIMLAASADETDVTKVMVVQLPNGTDIRTKLNLKDNAGNLGKEVVLYGSIENYFGQMGLKSVTFAVLDGVEIGTKPGSDPAPSGDVQTVTVSQFNDAAESTSVWYQLTGTISNLKAGDKYGNFDLTDATGSVYVYGVLSTKGGAKQKFQELVTAHNIQNGTTITIIGNRGSYNGKIEVVNAYFVSAQN
ncbi:DUF6359 domain-containing protein [Prevotella sp. E13-27]|uniref:DUF6359 domain-containing protein n=1 Tax=Prevotella sp. E13-27 TaxID=2938122 RepID=UPI002009FDF9|nr:DUF6359 domain-containing protein [Prevotella sp. E13-27]MCK8622852.1 DUF6359 domain-containing protein [Prevotella sp. E13-27]